jgi:hypothetical protein
MCLCQIRINRLCFKILQFFLAYYICDSRETRTQ